MMQALVSNRLEFVNLLLEHGLNMQKFLTPTRLEILYSYERKESEVLCMLIGDITKKKRQKNSGPKLDDKPAPNSVEEIITLHEIGVTMSHMMGHIYKSRYIHMVSNRTFEEEADYYVENRERCLHPFDDVSIRITRVPPSSSSWQMPLQ